MEEINNERKIPMEDCNIVKLFLIRDESAINAASTKYNKYLYKIAWNILSCHEDCVESVNDTYLRAWNSIPPHVPEILSTYLGKITRRLSIDIYRKRNALKRGNSEVEASLNELEECIPDNQNTEEVFDSMETGRIISDFLKKQKYFNRSIFISRYYYAMSIKEIAEKYRCSESRVKTTLHRTRVSLKNYLEKEGIVIG